MTLNAQWLDAGMLLLAGLFGLLGILFVFQGLFGGRNRNRYGVGRLRARRAAVGRLLQGIALLAVGALLVVAFQYFQPEPEPKIQLIATDVPQPTPTDVPPTVTPVPELPTPSTATEPPPPTNTPMVEAVTEEADISAEPTIELEPTEEPTPEPTAPPTKPPYDAEVRVVGGVNLRDAPNGNILMLIEDGSGVFLLDGRERAGRYAWQQVRTLDGTVGWVAEQFLVVIEK